MRVLYESDTELFRAVVTTTYPGGESGGFCLGPYTTPGVAKSAAGNVRRRFRRATVEVRIQRAAVTWEDVE